MANHHRDDKEKYRHGRLCNRESGAFLEDGRHKSVELPTGIYVLKLMSKSKALFTPQFINNSVQGDHGGQRLLLISFLFTCSKAMQINGS